MDGILRTLALTNGGRDLSRNQIAREIKFARLPMNEGMLPVSEMAELRRYLAMEAILVEMEPPQVRPGGMAIVRARKEDDDGEQEKLMVMGMSLLEVVAPKKKRRHDSRQRTRGPYITWRH
uniref:Uncharacterized protein n=1 Tax=Oryza rufipogon TaxID=4529 RepID=A0A0E0NBN7_ORYRU